MKKILLGIVFVAGIAAGANAQVASLELVGRPQLVECKGMPCFRLVLNGLDAEQRPVPLRVTDLATALTEWRVLEGATPQPLFFVGSLDAGDKVTLKGRYSMLLLDTSGSMAAALPRSGQTRFTAAKKAMLSWAANFADGVDHVAVVPFESHRVSERVRAADFAATADALRRQINALPTPLPSNNTALYSAIIEALTKLKPFRQAGYEVMLVVFTDGANDIRPGDDPGLLGPEGLDLARRAVTEASVPLFTIGFGAAGQTNFDERALKTLAWPGESNYRAATTAEALQEVFGTAREKLTNRIRLTVGPVADSKGQLAGRTIPFKVIFTRAGQAPVETTKETPWLSMGLGVPAWEGQLDAQEFEAFVSTRSGPVTTGLVPFRRLLVLAMYAALLALLWFGLPRMIWPERYVPQPVLASAPGRPQGAPQPRTMYARPPAAPAPQPRAPVPAGRTQGTYSDPRVTRQSPDQTVYIRPDVKPRPDPGRKGRDDA